MPSASGDNVEIIHQTALPKGRRENYNLIGGGNSPIIVAI